MDFNSSKFFLLNFLHSLFAKHFYCWQGFYYTAPQLAILHNMLYNILTSFNLVSNMANNLTLIIMH